MPTYLFFVKIQTSKVMIYNINNCHPISLLHYGSCYPFFEYGADIKGRCTIISEVEKDLSNKPRAGLDA